MTLPAGPHQDPPQDALVQRCESLGLVAWLRTGQGVAAHSPSAGPSAARWLACDLLCRWVSEAIQRWRSRSDVEPQPCDLFTGCRLIPLPPTAQDGPNRVVAAMMLGGSALEGEGFEAICAAAGVGCTQAKRELAVIARWAWPDPAQLATVLRWSREDLDQRAQDAATLDEFGEKLAQSYEETNLLYRVARLLNCSTSPAQLMEMICRQILEIMPFSWVAARFSDSGHVPELAGRLILAGDVPCGMESFTEQVGSTIAGWKGDHWTRVLTPDRNGLAALVGTEVLAEPIRYDQQAIGALLAGNKTGPETDLGSGETQFFDAAADLLGVFHENLARFEDQRTMFLGTLQGLTAAIDAKDHYTGGHSERVSLLSAQLAQELGLGDKRVEEVRVSGLVHDVGKIGVPESVLGKAGRLTDAEFALIKRHPQIGYDILKDIPPLLAMLPGVLHHHERWDGRGYPHGLAGEAIPLYGRIIACADAFDAMSSDRSYRSALTRGDVLAQYTAFAGKQFDPKLAAIFIKLDFTQFDRRLSAHQSKYERAA